jgi:hypothetical protein
MIINPGLLRFAGKSGSSLVAPGVLRTLSFSRAQVASASTALTSNGVTRAEFAADIPRFNDIARRLLIEGQRTNSVRNPRAAGAVVGSPGTLPTFWQTSGAAFVVNVAGLGTQDGLSYVDLAFTCDNSLGGTVANLIILPEANSAIAASSGQIWTGALSAARVGSLVNVSSTNITLRGRVGGSTVESTTVVISLTETLQRVVATRTLNNALTTSVNVSLDLAVPAGAIASGTIRLAAPQVELGAFVSSPIFPSVGTPATSTRGADTLNDLISKFNIGASGASTILMSVLLPLSTATSGALGLVAISDGTNSNRLYVRSGGGNTIVLNNTVGGVNATLVGTANAWTPGTVFRLGIVALGDGTIRVALNAGAIVSQAGGPTSGLTTLRIGSDALGGAPMFGEINSLKILPYALADTDLQNAVASIPV